MDVKADMVDQGPLWVLSNRTCQICEEDEANHFCKCLGTPTLFCLSCIARHHSKYPQAVHQVMPIAAFDQNPEEYRRKSAAHLKAVAALRSNVERMEQFSTDFEGIMQQCLDYLAEYRSRWLGFLQVETEQLRVLIEEAVQECDYCLGKGRQPVNPLAFALWTFPPENLNVINFSVTCPDVEDVFKTCATYQNRLQDLCRSASNQPPEASKEQTPPSRLFAAVCYNNLELYDLNSQQSTHHILPVNFSKGGSFISLTSTKLLCLGRDPPSTAAYELDLCSLQLSSLPSLHTPRAFAGVAMASNIVYVFGGGDDSYTRLKSCEKYGLLDSQWLPLGDMQHARMSFTPCNFRASIYLPCPLSTSVIEIFSPATEVFSVLPVSLPPEMKGFFSIAFVAHGQLYVLTSGKQMGRWKIDSKSEFSLFATTKGCCSTQPPLVMDTLVLIANHYFESKGVERFSLQSCTFT